MDSKEAEQPASCFERRRAGVLLHVTSLPSPGPCGDLGREARNFVDFLAAAGMRVWQTLPVGPTGPNGSPYQSSSVHAGNPRLISLEGPVERGWLGGPRLDWGHLSDERKRLALTESWDGFKVRAEAEDRDALERFQADNAYWLEDYALFQALRLEHGTGWWEWPQGLRDRESGALAAVRRRLAPVVDYLKYEQFLFFSQWHALRSYANARGVLLFGDMPIFVAHDSAEVWARPQDFDLNADGTPRVVAGVPPDYFSATGQRWGNPLYRWEQMHADDYAFWIARMRTQLGLYDMVRIDHFRGFEAYWEIPASEPNAIHGTWVRAEGDTLFERLYREFGNLPLVAEDLGIITPEVEALRRRHALPGMKVLQFAFSGGADNPYLPFRHTCDSVVYTGTHDNDTSLGWYLSLDEGARRYVDEYLGHPREPMPWPLIRAALGSVSALAVVPMQDLLELNGEHRMNLPGTMDDNWGWRFSWGQVDPGLATRVQGQVAMYGRLD
jgi:4-alpha-glucanotransferase